MLNALWSLIANRVIPAHAVTAGPLRALGGHQAWNTQPWVPSPHA